MGVKFNYEKFRELREERKVSQMKLAEMSGTSDRYIRAMEAGEKTNPSATKLYSMCRVLRQQIESFMVDTQDGFPEDR